MLTTCRPKSTVGFPGAPSIRSVTPGEGSLTVTWDAPSSDGGSAITAYYLRYTRTKGGGNLLGGRVRVWTSDSGALSYELTGLAEDTQWDLEVQAVNSRGEGPWSAAVSGTPTQATQATQATAATDFNEDGKTDFVDFFLLVDAYGGTDARFDLDGSGTVDFVDFFQFVDAFDQPGQAKLLALAHERLGLPSETELQQNWPNPFNSETVISWFLLEPGPVAAGGFLPDGTAGGGAAAGAAQGRPPPRPLERPGRYGPPPCQRRLPVPAGDGRDRPDAQAHTAAMIFPECLRAISHPSLYPMVHIIFECWYFRHFSAAFFQCFRSEKRRCSPRNGE